MAVEVYDFVPNPIYILYNKNMLKQNNKWENTNILTQEECLTFY